MVSGKSASCGFSGVPGSEPQRADSGIMIPQPDTCEPETESACCPICGEKPANLVFTASDRLYGLMGRFKYRSCTGCGLIRLDPRPKRSAMAAYYRETDNLLKRGKGTGPRRPLLKKIEKLFRSGRAREIIRIQKLEAGNRIVDVGSGPGSFLRFMRMISPGISAVGVDNSIEACRWAERVHSQNSVYGDALRLPFIDNVFHLITMWHFLEHSYDLNGTLEECGRLIDDGGVVAIEVPNYHGPFIRMLGGKWIGLLTPLHLYQFTPETISRLLESHGFEVIAIKHKLFIPFLLGGLVLTAPKQPRSRKDLAMMIPLVFLSFLLEWPVALAAKLTRRGYVITCYARKPLAVSVEPGSSS